MLYLNFPESPERLTPAEQNILDFIEEYREEFLFMTIGQMAERLGVSEATISRFARHMGCQDFKSLKAAVMEQSRPQGAVGKLAQTLLKDEAFQAAGYFQTQMRFLEKTAENLDPEVFDQAAAAILSAGRIFIHGKSASASMAQLLFFRLRRLGLAVSLLPSGGSEIAEGLALAGPKDLVILFCFSKISSEARFLLDCRKTAGYKTLAFTSRLRAQPKEQADLNLYVCRGPEQEYHSMTAAAAMIDALVVAISKKAGPEGMKNLSAVQDLKKRYGNGT